MERELRRKFVGIAFAVVFVVLFAMASVINIINYVGVDDSADEVIALLVEHDGSFPLVFDRPQGHLTVETPYTTRYFAVKVDNENNLISVDTRSVQLVNTEQAIAYAEDVLNGGATIGFADNYRFALTEAEYGKLMVFVDCTQELTIFYTFLRASVLICAIALLGVFVLMVVLSKKAVFPIVESYRKQQQFITNITHELKTPLAIIKTNTEVIEMTGETSQWSESIHNQIGRLNELINYLISLSKLEEGETLTPKVDFSLSDGVSEVVESFYTLAENKGHTIVPTIASNITYHGDERSIRLLTSILMDNALKYSSEQSAVAIAMEKVGTKVHMEVTNQAEGLEIGSYNMLFERFYRMDGSRNSQLGGFGIGLAMAKSIVKNHGGTIKAESRDGKTMRVYVEL